MTEPAPSQSRAIPDDAFDALVRAHYGRLCNFAHRYVDSRDVAEDIVQDVFARLWRQHDAFDVRDPLPYLYQAVRNRAVTYRRQRVVRDRWREQQTLRDDDRQEPDTASAVEVADLAEAVRRAIDALPERCRLVFTMSREQDLTYAEIARALGISVKTVETQMGRALKALRTLLAGYLSVALVAAIGPRCLG